MKTKIKSLIIIFLISLSAYYSYADNLSLLEEARSLMDKGRYRKARKILKRILKRGGNSQGVVAEIYRRLGWCEGALRKRRLAQESFKKLLLIRPEYRLPTLVSPIIKIPFKRAIKFWKENKRAVIIHSAPPSPKKETSVEIKAKLEGNDLGLLSSVVLYLKKGRQKVYRKLKPIKISKDEYLWRLDIKKGEKILYYIVALDKYNNEILLSGTSENPFIIEIKEEKPKPLPTKIYLPTAKREVEKPAPIYKKWWFWTIVGAVILSGVTTGVVLGVSRESESFCSSVDTDFCRELE